MTAGLNTLMHFKAAQKRFDPTLLTPLTNSIVQHTIEVERAFNAVTSASAELSNQEVVKVLSFDRISKYIALMNKRWAAVRPLLLPHALSSLVPTQ